LMAIKAQGAVTVVQSDPECSGMPLRPRSHVDVDHVVPLQRIAP